MIILSQIYHTEVFLKWKEKYIYFFYLFWKKDRCHTLWPRVLRDLRRVFLFYWKPTPDNSFCLYMILSRNQESLVMRLERSTRHYRFIYTPVSHWHHFDIPRRSPIFDERDFNNIQKGPSCHHQQASYLEWPQLQTSLPSCFKEMHDKTSDRTLVNKTTRQGIIVVVMS